MIRTASPRLLLSAPALLLALLLVSPRAGAQGRSDLLNVESPPVHPLEVAQVGDQHVLLVANTADSSVEVWLTDESLPVSERFAGRMPTGLEPVSVRWSAALGRFYTANFLGDSVSVGRLELDDQGGVRAVLERTRHVGDEPMDIAFVDAPVQLAQAQAGLQPGPAPAPAPLGPGGPGGRGGFGPAPAGPATRPAIVVSLTSSHRLARHDALSLDPIGARIELVDAQVSPPRSLREPRGLLTRGGKLLALGLKGGQGATYDFDVFIADAAGAHLASLGGLGSTNSAMAFDAAGDLFVVGGEAQNQLQSEPLVAAAPTGFVKSTLYWVRDPLGTPEVLRRDLNAQLDPPGGVPTPVAPSRALALPTDVVVFEPVGGPRKVFLAAMGSDRVGVLEPDALLAPSAWPTRRIELPLQPGSELLATGPRALALRGADPAGHLPARLYVLERFSNRISVIDPDSEQLLTSFALEADPTPPWVAAGRPWLYSARHTSGNGFVACASCHVDGRTDGLVWNLGDPDAPRDPFPLHLVSGLPRDEFLDGDCDDNLNTLFADFVINGFPQKFGMMTQSLQGLLNFETDPAGETSSLFTNANYHWRADRPGLEAFNGAFVNLQGLDPIPGSEPPQGLTGGEMQQLVDFINSIHYPPNPLQPVTRVYDGSMGDPADAQSGAGTLRGLKLFHTQPLETCFGMSCSQCHALPEGSDNRITEMAPELLFYQPLETPALRGLIQKESHRDDGPGAISDIVLGESGLGHSGGNVSINDFDQTFVFDFGGPQHEGFPEQLVDVNDFVRKLDSGVAPIVGRVLSVDVAQADQARILQELSLLESQARLANAGLAVQARLHDDERGFWYDLTGAQARYRREPDGLGLTRVQLLDQLGSDGDLLVFQSVPLGSERRIASVRPPLPLPGPAPAQLELLGLVPNTAYADIPTLTRNWSPFDPDPEQAFSWVNPCGPTPRGPKGVRLLQWGLLQDAASEGAFGLDGLRHEAPRRIRVAGHGIRHGAQLQLLMPSGPLPPDTSAGPSGSSTSALILNLHPSGATHAGRRVWETAAELDPLALYALMLGGPAAPGVFSAAFDTFDVLPEPPLPGSFDPLAWNWYWVRVLNTDGSVGDGGWQRLRLP